MATRGANSTAISMFSTRDACPVKQYFYERWRVNDGAFEWDDAKNISNFAKHGVTFERARLVFADLFAVGETDDRDDYGEDRFTLTGMVQGTLLSVAYPERGGREAATDQEHSDQCMERGEDQRPRAHL